MRPADVSLLLKKIAVGVAITAIPLLIIAGGLWLTRAVLDHPQGAPVSAPHGAHP